MLAYRHAFHAGNHADVLKHVVLARVLRHMNAKPKPYRYVDTHAGAGGYSLEGPYALKKGEYREGIGRLWTRDDLPPAVADYVELVRRFNPPGRLEQYPGSPAIARMLRREHDELRLYERHPTDHRILAAYLADARRAEVRLADGFDAAKSQLPPPTRRGVVLIDPSYEGRGDYARVGATLREALARFSEAVCLVWYPQVQKVEAAELPRRLHGAAGARGWLHARLSVQRADAEGYGLAGSGVYVVNPPYTLADELAGVLPYLARVLGQFEGASGSLEQHAV